MNKTQLAKELGVSRQMVHRLANQGMPCDSIESAKRWRERYLLTHITKNERIDGNTGLKRSQENSLERQPDITLLSGDPLTTAEIKMLTEVVPVLWFQHIGWLAITLRDHGVKITAEQLIYVQQDLFFTYMSEVDDYLKTENNFTSPHILEIESFDKAFPTLIARLKQILRNEPTYGKLSDTKKEWLEHVKEMQKSPL